ncbi:hypothetical protein CH292_25595 [Rhodococcus sp. 14-2470-1a]|nr:hypothetical protein CH292_25595 [Rhodococcus sp. 14-2470-1a]
MMAALSDWYRQPHDFEWVLTHRSTRPLHSVVRAVFAAGTLLFALCSVVMLFSSHGPSGTISTTWVWVLLVVQIMVAVRWCIGPMPGRRGFIAFALFGDVGLASMLVLYDPVGALIGSVLFAVTGAFCTYFLSPRWLVAHVSFSTAVIIGFAVYAHRGAVEDPATIVAGVLVVLAGVNGVPLFAHVAWTAISRDARRAALDSLTGLYNRRGMDSALTDLWEHAQQRRWDVAAVVIDIDKFKRVNDQYGHAAGDRVIVSVADGLTEYVLATLPVETDRRGRRRTDTAAASVTSVLARTGGEEFLAVLAAPPGDIQDRIDGLGPALGADDARPVPVTVSIGAAILTPESALREMGLPALERLIRSADTMMYRAKKQGGDRVLCTAL